MGESGRDARIQGSRQGDRWEGSMEIERLNALMFEAEAHRDCEGLPWAEFLGHVLADDFALRRSAASHDGRSAAVTAQCRARPRTSHG